MKTTRAQRLEYVESHLDMYYNFLGEVENSPFGPIDMMEFAAISANTSMESAINGFLATRDKETVTEIGEAFLFWGVNAPFNKAAFCMGMRELDPSLIPNPNIDLMAQRAEAVPQIKGLGYAKFSFAACLIAPFESDIVCLDTHMYQTYIGKVPSSKDLYGKSKRCIRRYERIESLIRGEAEIAGVPPFLYQWAVWDLQRKLIQNSAPERHDFLWQSGPSVRQLTMDGVEIAG